MWAYVQADAGKKDDVHGSSADRVPRNKLAKGGSSASIIKGCVYTSKLQASKRKTEKSGKHTGRTQVRAEDESACSSFPAKDAFGKKSALQKPKEEWREEVERRRSNRSSHENFHASEDRAQQQAPLPKVSSAAPPSTSAVVAASPIEDIVPQLGTHATVAIEAIDQADSLLPRCKLPSSQESQHSISAAPASPLACEKKTSICADHESEQQPLSIGSWPATALTAADEKSHSKIVCSKDSFSNCDTLLFGSKLEEHGFTLATSRNRKPTVRKHTAEWPYFNGGPPPTREAASTQTDAMLQPTVVACATIGSQNNSKCLSQGERKQPSENRSTHCRAQKEVRSNNQTVQLPSNVSGRHVRSLENSNVCIMNNAGVLLQQSEANLPVILEEERSKKNQRAVERFEQRLELLEKQQQPENSTKSRESQKVTGEVQREGSFAKQVTAPAATKNDTSLDEAHAEELLKKEASAVGNGADPGTLDVMSRLESIEDKQNFTAEQSTSLPSASEIENESVVLPERETRTAQTTEEGGSAVLKVQEGKQSEPAKRWGDRLSDDEDDMCSWGSRESNDKPTSCFPFNQTTPVAAQTAGYASRDTPFAGARHEKANNSAAKERISYYIAAGLHVTGDSRGSSSWVEKQRRGGARNSCFRSRNRNIQGTCRAAPPPAERSDLCLPSGGSAFGHVSLREIQQKKEAESLPYAKAEAAACWPSLSRAAQVKASKSAVVVTNGAASTNLASLLEQLTRRRGSSFGPDSALRGRRHRLRRAEWQLASGEAGDKDVCNPSLTTTKHAAATAAVTAAAANATASAAVSGLQPAPMWRVRNPPLQSQAAAKVSSVPSEASSSTCKPSLSKEELAEHPASPGAPQLVLNAPFLDDRDYYAQENIVPIPMYTQPLELSSGCGQQLHPPAGAVMFQPRPAGRLSESSNFFFQGRGTRRRYPGRQRRPGGRFVSAGFDRRPFNSQAPQQQQQQQHTCFYSYNVPPPPPPPPPEGGYYSEEQRTYLSTSERAYEGSDSQAVTEDAVGRDLLLSHQHEQQLQHRHQLLGALHPYHESSACYVPVAYSTPAALYDVQQQLGYPCSAWVYPSASSVPSHEKVKAGRELEENLRKPLGEQHECQREDDVTGFSTSGENGVTGGHGFSTADALGREGTALEGWQRLRDCPPHTCMLTAGEGGEPQEQQQQQQQRDRLVEKELRSQHEQPQQQKDGEEGEQEEALQEREYDHRQGQQQGQQHYCFQQQEKGDQQLSQQHQHHSAHQIGCEGMSGKESCRSNQGECKDRAQAAQTRGGVARSTEAGGQAECSDSANGEGGSRGAAPVEKKSSRAGDSKKETYTRRAAGPSKSLCPAQEQRQQAATTGAAAAADQEHVVTAPDCNSCPSSLLLASRAGHEEEREAIIATVESAKNESTPPQLIAAGEGGTTSSKTAQTVCTDVTEQKELPKKKRRKSRELPFERQNLQTEARTPFDNTEEQVNSSAASKPSETVAEGINPTDGNSPSICRLNGTSDQCRSRQLDSAFSEKFKTVEESQVLQAAVENERKGTSGESLIYRENTDSKVYTRPQRKGKQTYIDKTTRPSCLSKVEEKALPGSSQEVGNNNKEGAVPSIRGDRTLPNSEKPAKTTSFGKVAQQLMLQPTTVENGRCGKVLSKPEELSQEESTRLCEISQQPSQQTKEKTGFQSILQQKREEEMHGGPLPHHQEFAALEEGEEFVKRSADERITEESSGGVQQPGRDQKIDTTQHQLNQEKIFWTHCGESQKKSTETGSAAKFTAGMPPRGSVPCKGKKW